MGLKNEEMKKFADVFVDIYEYGNKTAYTNEHEEILKRYIDEDLLDRWKAYLNSVCEKFFDADDYDGYDEWFNNLKDIEDIDPKKSARYDLPDHRIIINFGNETTFMRRLLSLSRKFIDSCEPYCEHTNLGAAYQFTEQAVFVSIYTYDDYYATDEENREKNRKMKEENKDKSLDKDLKKELKEALKARDDAFASLKSLFTKNFLPAAEKLGEDFNSVQVGENAAHVHIGASQKDRYLMGNPVYERTFSIDDGCDTLVIPKKNSSTSEKSIVSQEYAKMFYTQVPSESRWVGTKFKE